MEKMIAKVLITMLALLITAALIPGIIVNSVWAGFWAALILGIVNVIVKPILIILTLPITILTLGLFWFVINGIMLWLTSGLVSGFYISGFWAAVFGAIILSLVSSLLNKTMSK